MIPYLVVGALLWLVTLITQEGREDSLWGALCLLLMVAFTGLRYEIGYDWLAYESYFEWLKPDLTWATYRTSQAVLPVEYLYFVLNAVVKMFGGSFEFLLFVISLFNLFVIDRMAKSIDSTSRPFVWLMYFCLALIMVQFNIIRQSIASSFIILALIYRCRSKYFYSIVYLVIAFGFHTSTAVFWPIILLADRNVKTKYIIYTLVTSALIFVVGNAFLANVLGAIADYLPGGISEKTDSYATGIAGGNVWGVSPLAALLIIFYLILLRIFLRLQRDTYVNVAILLTVTVLVAHVAFGRVPIIWNRVMCVSLPWQFAILWKHYVKPMPAGIRGTGLFFGGIAALSVFSFQLTRLENVAFVPYHSLLQVWLFDDKGDGRLRSMYAVQQGQIEQAQRASQ